MQAERCGERLALWAWDRFDVLEHWRAQLVEGGKRELHLRFHANGSHDAEFPYRPDRVIEQRRLADAGLPAQDDHTAPAAPGRFEQAIQHHSFAVPSLQHRLMSSALVRVVRPRPGRTL